MKRQGRGLRISVFGVVGAALAVSWAQATTLLQLNLEQLTARSHRIFRGTVVSAERGAIDVGGGHLPTITYRIRVAETFKGEVPLAEAGARFVEMRMVAEPEGGGTGSVHRASLLRDVPRLEVGREYLLFATRQSAVGLSTTVGLGQGCFTVHGAGRDGTAVNAYANVDLFRGVTAGVPTRGPVSYGALARRIRALVNR